MSTNPIIHYFEKWGGTSIPSVGIPPPHIKVVISSFIASFLGILCVSSLHYLAPSESYFHEHAMLGSYGAIAVLIYSAIDSPLAQPRQVIFGNLISAFVGVSVRLVLVSACQQVDTCIISFIPLACAFAVSLSIVAMGITLTTHPPGGATALIAVTAPPSMTNVGYLFLLSPVLLGTSIMLLVALIVNNVLRRYPVFWLRPVKEPHVPAETIVKEEIEMDDGTSLDGLQDVEAEMMEEDKKEVEIHRRLSVKIDP